MARDGFAGARLRAQPPRSALGRVLHGPAQVTGDDRAAAMDAVAIDNRIALFFVKLGG